MIVFRSLILKHMHLRGNLVQEGMVRGILLIQQVSLSMWPITVSMFLTIIVGYNDLSSVRSNIGILGDEHVEMAIINLHAKVALVPRLLR